MEDIDPLQEDPEEVMSDTEYQMEREQNEMNKDYFMEPDDRKRERLYFQKKFNMSPSEAK